MGRTLECAPPDQTGDAMLTTSLDGLWLLQALTGIEVLAPELGLRPHLPSVETAAAALGHPVAEELRSAGVIDADGRVDQTVLEWLTVLARREVGLLLHARTPAAGAAPEQALLARFARWWVSIERCGNVVRLHGAATATGRQSADLVIRGQIERLCGVMAPASVRPLTLDVANLLNSARAGASLRGFLVGHRFDGDQVDTLVLAADSERSAQATLVAIESGVNGGPARSHIGPGAVTIIDTPRGRLLAEHTDRDGRSWMVVGPGSTANIVAASLNLMRRLPAGDDWHVRRKAV